MLLQIVNMIINLILPRIILWYGSATTALFHRQFTQYISVVEGGLFTAVYALYNLWQM